MDSGADTEVSAQLRLFAEQTTNFVGVADGWGRILYLNPAARKRLGVADATELTLADVFPSEAFTLYYEVARPQLLRTGVWSGQILVNVAGEGAVPMYASTSATLGPGGEINGLVVYARELPRSDPVGVTDGSSFDDRVRDALAAAHRDGEACALVLVNILSMNDTIETFGELAAASVMRSLVGRLTRLARSIDIVGRVGEHQLGLLLRGVRSHGEALRIAEMVYDSLVDPPVTTAGGEVVVSVACGVAFSKSRDDPVDLIDRASAAMASEAGIRDVDDGAPIAVTDRSEVAATMDDFRLGVSHGDVRPFAQPVVDLRSGLLVGYRGLARWQHRRLGMLEASAFIDMISDTPLASQVDLLVARETAAVITLLLRDTPLRLYTPVSKRLIADVRAEQYLSEIADAFFLSTNQICVQLARPLLDNWSPALQEALQSLSDAGFASALTGVEHASDTEVLAEHPFDELHISPRLTNATTTDPDARRALSEIVRLAHERALLVAATGVNDQQHHDLLRETGCDLASGDLYGRPEPAHTID